MEGETLAIVMELVNGTDLRRVLREQGPLAPLQTARVMAPICAGLAAIHAQCICHRDIKPENILIEDAGGVWAPKITDFGISTFTDPSVLTTRPTVIAGTPSYMAPELIAGGAPTVRSDLYAVGIVLYELCCGVTPFQASATVAVQAGHVERRPGRPHGVPDPLWRLIERLLAKDPAQRPASADEVAADLISMTPVLVGYPPAPAITSPPVGAPARAAEGGAGPPTRVAAYDRQDAAGWYDAPPPSAPAPPSQPSQPSQPRQADESPTVLRPPVGGADPVAAAPVVPGPAAGRGSRARVALLAGALMVAATGGGLALRNWAMARPVTPLATPTVTVTPVPSPPPPPSPPPRTTEPAPPSYQPVAVTVVHSCGATGRGDCYVSERVRPSTSSREIARHAEGATLSVVCQVNGTFHRPSATGRGTRIWSRTTNGGYVATGFLDGVNQSSVTTAC